MKLKVAWWWCVSLLLLAAAVSAQEEEEEEEEGATEGPGKTSSGPRKPVFKEPSYPSGDVYLVETFTDSAEVWERWVKSAAKKEDGSTRYEGEWELRSPDWDGAMEDDQYLVIPEAAKHYALSAKLERPFVFDGKEGFVVQYEVNFQEGLSCGGAYIKLLVDTPDLKLFHDKTPYSIMFGPDKCGMSSKVHMIIQFKNPVTGEVEEKHSKQSTESMGFFDDKKTHLITLLVRSDGVYHIIVDQVPFLKGTLLDDLTPPIIPSEEIDEPEDEKPADWDEREKIPDPDAVKPDDWDEDAPQKISDPDAEKPDGWLDKGPEYIPDPDASMPDDWDEEEDGEWEAPQIPNPACEEVGCGEWEPPLIQNPAYKGKWRPPLIDNPDFMGIWKPKRIPNPAYFEDEHPFDSLLTITAVGLELWTMSGSIFFDNFLVCSELTIANNFAREGWTLKFEYERAVDGATSLGPFLDWFIDTANDRPYLWALYAFTIVIPFVICAAFCVRSKPDEAAKRKKTDEPTPDDPQPSPPGEEGEREETSSAQPGGGEGDSGGDQSFIAEAGDEDEEPEEEGGGATGGETQEEDEEEEEGEGEGAVGSQGEQSQEETGKSSQGEGEDSQDGGPEEEETAAPTKEATAKGGKARKRKKQRRED